MSSTTDGKLSRGEKKNIAGFQQKIETTPNAFHNNKNNDFTDIFKFKSIVICPWICSVK